MMVGVGSRTDEAIYAAHARELTVFARSLVGPDDAADVVSEVFVSAFGSPGWAEVENQRAYLYRSVFNRSQTHLRRSSSREIAETRSQSRAATGGIQSDVADLPDPAVLEAVEQLSTQQRAVIALTYWRDLPVGEVASILGVSDGAVRKQLARARARLREVLDDQR